MFLDMRKYSHMSNRSPSEIHLSRRERQIMDVLYSREEMTAREVLDALPDPSGYSSVRKQLSLLVEKGIVCSRQEGRALIYRPATPRSSAAKSALRKIVDTFFSGSVSAAMTGLLNLDEEALSQDEAERLKEEIRKSAQPESDQPQ